MDPHVYGPHLDWPFGGAIHDINHIPGLGAGTNEKLPFPQFRQVFPPDSERESENENGEANADADADTDADVDVDADANAETAVVDSEFDVDASNRVIPRRQACVNCAYRD